MIEVIDNVIQLAVTGICAVIILVIAIIRGGRERALLCLMEGTLFLGCLFWTLFQIFYDEAPKYFIAEMGWYSSYLFLMLLVVQIRHPDLIRTRYKAAWAGPVFCFAMGIFYCILSGDYFSNLICAVVMSALTYHVISALLFQRGRTDEETRKRFFYWVTAAFCIVEYTLWTLSCFWMGDTIANPYYWADFALTACCALLLPALRKVVRG